MSLEAALRPTLTEMWSKPCPGKDVQEGRKPDFSQFVLRIH